MSYVSLNIWPPNKYLTILKLLSKTSLISWVSLGLDKVLVLVIENEKIQRLFHNSTFFFSLFLFSFLDFCFVISASTVCSRLIEFVNCILHFQSSMIFMFLGLKILFVFFHVEYNLKISRFFCTISYIFLLLFIYLWFLDIAQFLLRVNHITFVCKYYWESYTLSLDVINELNWIS